jgi:hypothetical protein
MNHARVPVSAIRSVARLGGDAESDVDQASRADAAERRPTVAVTEESTYIVATPAQPLRSAFHSELDEIHIAIVPSPHGSRKTPRGLAAARPDRFRTGTRGSAPSNGEIAGGCNATPLPSRDRWSDAFG